MLKSFKILIVLASLVGFFAILPTNFANAGFASVSDCVDFVKSNCEEGQYKECVDSCGYLNRRDKGICIANCNIEVACCLDRDLDDICGIGADSHPVFCQ